MRILDLLAETSRPLKVTEIAGALDIPRSAAYELVSTLKVYGAVEMAESGAVTLGSKLLMLGAAVQANVDLPHLAANTARAVTQRLDETSQVGVLDGRNVLYIAKSDSRRELRLVSAVGRRLPAHCTGLGKVLLAALPDETFDALFRAVELERLTPTSISDRLSLERELHQIREQGYGLDHGESNPDIECVAAPVHDATGTVAAAISISVPRMRMTDEYRDILLNETLRAATEMSIALGYNAAFHQRGNHPSMPFSNTGRER